MRVIVRASSLSEMVGKAIVGRAVVVVLVMRSTISTPVVSDNLDSKLSWISFRKRDKRPRWPDGQPADQAAKIAA